MKISDCRPCQYCQKAFSVRFDFNPSKTKNFKLVGTTSEKPKPFSYCRLYGKPCADVKSCHIRKETIMPDNEKPFCNRTDKDCCDERECPFNDCGCCFAYRLEHEFDDNNDLEDPEDEK